VEGDSIELNSPHRRERFAGVVGDRNDAACVTFEGTPKMSLISPERITVSVVKTVPNWRARAANMNDHTAGMTDANSVTSQAKGASAR
jgi:hypothetical protein